MLAWLQTMLVNADFSLRVVLRPADRAWTASPLPGVERQMLDRVGAEVARATSIVRYAPHSRFSAHSHGGGEEFLVLAGVFSDEAGDYAPGTYVRNPIGSRHVPRSDAGCVIFVKLHQFARGDGERKVIDTRTATFLPGHDAGVTVLPLHEFGSERVRLERWEPATLLRPHRHPGGEETLVLEGAFRDELGEYPAWSWLRQPHGSEHAPSSEAGCLLYIKSGHLPGAA